MKISLHAETQTGSKTSAANCKIAVVQDNSPKKKPLGSKSKASGSGKASTSEKKKPLEVQIWPSSLRAALAAAGENDEISSRFQDVVFFRSRTRIEDEPHILAIGRGKKTDHESTRQLAGSLCRSLKSHKVKSAEWDFQGFGSGSELADHLRAAVEGLLLADYEFDELKSKKSSDKTPELEVKLLVRNAQDPKLKAALAEAICLSESIGVARRLADLPGNLMTPKILADSIQAEVKGTGIKCSIWDKERIKKEHMGGLLGVAQGSHQDPRFIVLEYKGSSDAPLVYVGKGLTFDTGGISLKPSAAMEEMKYDMCGGANVLASVLAIAKMKLKVHAVALVPATENMPGGLATKPGDVHKARNGKSFEVNNTDAEGRLILSDALCYGSELKPKLMVDAATLTGAIVVALGNTHTGYFTRDSKLRDQIEKAAQRSGELVWQLPLVDDHVSDMKGTFADLSNISSGKGAGSATAAAFLEQFVEEGIPWAHFDIAGTAYFTGGRLSYNPKKGASGAMIRTFYELAKMNQAK